MRKFLTLLVMVVFTTFAMAQNKTVTGKVTDEKGAPVANASVLVKGTTKGVTTNNDGSFSISVPATAKSLVVSSVGFGAKEVTIKGTSLSVSLQAISSTLDEVVITGYGKQKRSQFSGAASSISVKGVETVPVGAFDQAFQGRSPGLLANSGSGQPGASANITIRGIQSIAGAGVQPLYILDGVPLPASDFQALNPNDFESITVLKDAASAGIYGARGGLGVIVITSKKGKSGLANFQYRSQFGFTMIPNFDRLNLMSTAEMLEYEEREKFAGVAGWVYSPLNPAIPAGGSVASKQKSLDSIKAINSYWPDILYRTGLSQSHELNLSGGNDKTKYYLSGSYFKQEGIDLGSALTRYTTRFNLEHTQNKLTVNLNMAIGYSKTLLSEGEFLGNSARNPFQMTYRAKPYENPYKADGTLNFGASNNLSIKQVANLLEGIQNSSRNDNSIKVNGGLTLAYKILPTLVARNTFGIDVNSNYVNRYVNANSYIGTLQTFNSGRTTESYRLSSNLINTSSLVYSNTFGGVHEIEAGGYFEVIQNYQRGLGLDLYNLDGRLTGTGQGAGALTTTTGSYNQSGTSAKSGYGIRSYFGTLKYTYDGKYTINGTIRRDGTSRIVNLANKEVTNWSAGFTWDAIKENFLKDQSFLTDLRLRASYGIVPNIGSIATGAYGLYIGPSITNFEGPQVPSFGTTTYAGSTISGQAPSSTGNPNLKIETIKKANIGIDFAIWKNRARFTVDAYYNRTEDLFVNQTIPATSGFGSGATLAINAGVMTNKGLEFTASVDVLKTKNAGITFGWNHSINVNNIEDLGQVSEYVVGTSIIRKGLPFGSAFTYNYLGADPATGRPTYYGPDGKTIVYSVANAGQFAFQSYIPKHVGGFTLDLHYKAISVSALFSYQTGVYRYDNTRNWITRGTFGYQSAVRGSRELLTEQWTKPGDVKLFQSSQYDRDFTSADLNNAKFLRFRNLNVAYAIPTLKTANGTVLIKSARFYVQGQNLAIWSPWKGLDPEDSNNISLNEYPNPRAFVVGLDINF